MGFGLLSLVILDWITSFQPSICCILDNWPSVDMGSCCKPTSLLSYFPRDSWFTSLTMIYLQTKVSCNIDLSGFRDEIIGIDMESEMLHLPQAFPLPMID